jgi:2-amino-4-hydroxy-6-hydroxymethyldihydropteridine diphosphokinase
VTRSFLSLGSNLGDRLGYLRAAVEALERGPVIEVTGVSKVYETDPVEVDDGQPDYLNCVVEIRYGASAAELLRFCQGVEAALGRTGKGGRLPRTVDIDILLFDEEIVEGAYLEVPHRGVLRAFNLVGIADLAPDVFVPGRGAVRGLLAGADLSGVREFGESL